MEGYIPKCDAYIELMKCKDFDTDKLYHGNHYLKIACDVIRSIPPADVVERKKGKWVLSEFQSKEETDNDNYQYECSYCGHGDLHAKSATVPYCWFCGAEME